MITLGEWLPDQPPLNNTVKVAENCIPAAQGYRSMSGFVPYSNAADSTILGIFAAKDNADNTKLFAGDAGKLYLHNTSTNNLDDVSKAGSPAYDLTDGEKWKFVQFGDNVIAAGGRGEELQKFQGGTDSAFSDLSASAPKAQHLAVVRDFIWAGDVDDGAGRIPYRVRWSAFNDITGWTSGTGQSDFQDIPDSGKVMGLVGGEYCTILTERAIYRATYSGLPLVFQFDKIDAERGCAFSGSVCNIGSLVFYCSDDGFYAFDGSKSVPIGSEKINDFFLSDFDSNYASRMTASVDPSQETAMFSYTSVNSPSGQPDRILIYNYVLNRWSIANIEADLLAPFFSAGYTADGLTNLETLVDDLDQAVDSRFFKGGQYVFGGAYGSKIYAFNGAPIDATIETGEMALSQGKHSIVTRVYPYYEQGTVTVQIGVRNTHSADPTFSAASSENDEGFCPFRTQGRYHSARLNLSNSWDTVQGLYFDAREIGRR